MTKTDELMRLADVSASAEAKAQLESLYGTSKSYTLLCVTESAAARAALRSAIQEAVRDAERYRWLKLNGVTPGQRPAAEEMPLGYKPIRLRVDTAVYLPTTWDADVDAAIDAAIRNTASLSGG